jgi:hypothetical protein
LSGGAEALKEAGTSTEKPYRSLLKLFQSAAWTATGVKNRPVRSIIARMDGLGSTKL